MNALAKLIPFRRAVEAETSFKPCERVKQLLGRTTGEFTIDETLEIQSTWPRAIIERLAVRDTPVGRACYDALTNLLHAEQRQAAKCYQNGLGVGGKGVGHR